MKYPVWFLRLLFASWMIPAGLNHFLPIFPQPMGTQPLSQELVIALIDSHLFDLVKAVELIAGLGVLFGFYTPLMLLICLPVSFGVFYWDAPLEGWGSRAAIFGYATLLTNVLLCLAYFRHYRDMFTLGAVTDHVNRQQLVLAGRLLFGAWMLLNGANYLFLSLWSAPTGQGPLAMQLMTALVNSRLLDVAMAFQLVAGAMLLAGAFVPLALCALMPITVCALFWALILDQQFLNTALALIAFAFNGFLMLAYLSHYQGVLERHALAIGETAGGQDHYDALFINPKGSTARAVFVPALMTVLAAVFFFGYFVTGRNAEFCMLTLMYPLFVLLARRTRDMGLPAWLVLVPLMVVLASFAIRLGYVSLGGMPGMLLPWVALVIAGLLAGLGCMKENVGIPG